MQVPSGVVTDMYDSAARLTKQSLRATVTALPVLQPFSSGPPEGYVRKLQLSAGCNREAQSPAPHAGVCCRTATTLSAHAVSRRRVRSEQAAGHTA